MSGQAKPHRRRIVYIHKTFQRDFILKFCLVALCAMIAASLLVYFFVEDTLTATYRYHHLALQRTNEAILPTLVVTNLAVLLVFLGATIVVTLYISHKIAGPLYRLSRSLESIGSGDLSFSIRMRERDQLEDVASTINKMSESLKDRVCQIRCDIEALNLKAREESCKPEEIRGDIDKLQRKLHQLFKTDKQKA